ncbi:MAG: cellulose biosynthesis protein BcsQ [Janthinobacterium lividum]
MNIVAVVSAKGGVGKTTVAANLAAAVVAAGRRVTVIDLDPQNALRLHFGMPPERIEGTSRATLGGAPWSSVVYAGRGGVSVLPYGAVNETDRHSFEQHLDTHPDWLHSNLRSLDPASTELVIIDTPPGPSVYLRQALSTAHFALTVVLADAASYATIPMMEGLLGTYCAERADFVGVAYVMNQVDQSRQLGRDVVKVLRNTLGSRVFPGLIHQDQAVGEALACDQTVLEYDALCQATQDFKACAQWVMNALDGAPGKRS